MWARALKQGDRLAIKLVADAVEALGGGVASAVNLLDVEAVIIGGGLGDRLGQPYVERILAAMRRTCSTTPTARGRPGRARDLGGALGGALLVRVAA